MTTVNNAPPTPIFCPSGEDMTGLVIYAAKERSMLSDKIDKGPSMSIQEHQEIRHYMILKYDGYVYFKTDEAPNVFNSRVEAEVKVLELIEKYKNTKRKPVQYFVKAFGCEDFFEERMKGIPPPSKKINPNDYYENY